MRLGGLGLASAALHSLRIRPIPAEAAAGYTADELPSAAAWLWFEQIYDVVKAERIAPPEASRIYALAAVSLYESVINGSPNHQSLAGQLNNLESPPRPLSDAIYWPAAASAALAATTRALVPSMSETSRVALAGLEGRQAEEFRASVSNETAEESGSYGEAVAKAVLEWASGDRMVANRRRSYSPGLLPGGWRPTPPAFSANPLEPGWGENRTMVMGSGSEGAPSGRPVFSLDPGSAFHSSALEVYRVGRNLTAEQKLIADYWADNPVATGTPPGHWIAIVSQISRNDRLPLATAAEAYARVGIAVHDAFICCWNVKYAHDLLRPVTYINDHVDPAWLPYIGTPSFPAYTSGHSTQSGAAATVLAGMFGRKRFRDTTHLDHNLTPRLEPRTFESFEQAAGEAAVSRLYGGIHYTFDNNDGYLSGQRLAQEILRRVRFRAAYPSG